MVLSMHVLTTTPSLPTGAVRPWQLRVLLDALEDAATRAEGSHSDGWEAFLLAPSLHTFGALLLNFCTCGCGASRAAAVTPASHIVQVKKRE